jgi:hypothetical protein
VIESWAKHPTVSQVSDLPAALRLATAWMRNGECGCG